MCSSPAAAWGPSRGRESSTNFSRVSPSHRLQFFTSLGPSPQGAVLQEQAAPAWVPHRVTGPARQPAPVQASHQVRASFRHIHLLCHGVLQVLQGDLCCPVNFQGLQGHSCLTRGFPQAAGEPQLQQLEQLLLLLFWRWCLQSCLLHIFSLFSSAAVVFCRFFAHLLQSVIPEAPPASLMGSDVARGSILESAALALLDTREASRIFSQEPALYHPPLPKPGHAQLHTNRIYFVCCYGAAFILSMKKQPTRAGNEWYRKGGSCCSWAG